MSALAVVRIAEVLGVDPEELIAALQAQIRAQNRSGCGVVISEETKSMGSTLHPVPIASCSRSSFKCMHSTEGV